MLAFVVRVSSRPPATTAYADGVVTEIWYDALSAGRSLHGYHDGAPMGWLATSAPSSSSSQPSPPHGLLTGSGLPDQCTSTVKAAPARTGLAGRTRSLPPRCV